MRVAHRSLKCSSLPNSQTAHIIKCDSYIRAAETNLGHLAHAVTQFQKHTHVRKTDLISTQIKKVSDCACAYLWVENSAVTRTQLNVQAPSRVILAFVLFYVNIPVCCCFSHR